MRKSTVVLTLVILITLFSTIAEADIVYLGCLDRWRRLLPEDVWSFDYDLQQLTLTDMISELPADPCIFDPTLMVRVVGLVDLDSRFTVIRNITNNTGATWTGFILKMRRTIIAGSASFVNGSAVSTKLQTITYPEWMIEFSGPEPVLDGESFMIQFDMQTDNTSHSSRLFDLILQQNPVAEPATAVFVDVKPRSCPNPLNVKSSGVLPVAILGSEDVDVNEIVETSILLEGVGAIRHSFEDVAAPVLDANDCNCTTDGPDGFLDLTLKFKTQEIVEVIGEVNDGDVLTLELTGVLFGETPIEGADCIVVVGKFKPFNKADINKDGMVDTLDFTIIADNWLESTILED